MIEAMKCSFVHFSWLFVVFVGLFLFPTGTCSVAVGRADFRCDGDWDDDNLRCGCDAMRCDTIRLIDWW